MEGYHLVKKLKTADTSFKPNNMDQVMDIEKLDEFHLLIKTLRKLGNKAKVWIVKKGDWYI